MFWVSQVGSGSRAFVGHKWSSWNPLALVPRKGSTCSSTVLASGVEGRNSCSSIACLSLSILFLLLSLLWEIALDPFHIIVLKIIHLMLSIALLPVHGFVASRLDRWRPTSDGSLPYPGLEGGVLAGSLWPGPRRFLI